MESLFTTNQKMFAVITNNIVSKVWAAESKEEAQVDNPESLIIEVTQENSPWFMYEEYDGRK